MLNYVGVLSFRGWSTLKVHSKNKLFHYHNFDAELVIVFDASRCDKIVTFKLNVIEDSLLKVGKRQKLRYRETFINGKKIVGQSPKSLTKCLANEQKNYEMTIKVYRQSCIT